MQRPPAQDTQSGTRNDAARSARNAGEPSFATTGHPEPAVVVVGLTPDDEVTGVVVVTSLSECGASSLADSGRPTGSSAKASASIGRSHDEHDAKSGPVSSTPPGRRANGGRPVAAKHTVHAHENTSADALPSSSICSGAK